MRTPLIAGNWKMNTDGKSAAALAKAVAAGAARFGRAEVAVCPPFVYLPEVGAALAGSPVGLGAQNMYHEPSGAFTGEVSAAMLLDAGCRYVILGHSERRQFFGESDAVVNRKVLAALKTPLTPIVCVGELLAQREAGQTSDVVRSQLAGSLAGLSEEQIRRVVVAYEPVWAIGTGKVATVDEAEAVHLDLRKTLESRYNAGVAAVVRILYGGSVKADNASQLLSAPNIDGALVGGASLKAEDFLSIVDAAR
ncbi:MAG: triose-phosphate isomerase [Planctomycetes bacterium]|nr:triose-phosphate isomerase [Planctomycetota bacterium]